jgi:hypothetical protein
MLIIVTSSPLTKIILTKIILPKILLTKILLLKLLPTKLLLFLIFLIVLPPLSRFLRVVASPILLINVLPAFPNFPNNVSTRSRRSILRCPAFPPLVTRWLLPTLSPNSCSVRDAYLLSYCLLTEYTSDNPLIRLKLWFPASLGVGTRLNS